jgi:hypothetical protein
MRLLHIGRSTTNDIVIADNTVSRQHAQLMVDDLGQATIIDLNSSNGTYVNGRRISAPTRLDQTDIVKVGEYMLPWRQYLQGGAPVHQTKSGTTPPPSSQAQYTQAPQTPRTEPSGKPSARPIILLVAGAGVAAILVIVIALLFFFPSGGKADLQGKWHEEGNKDAWIQFADNGAYTEGFKDAVVYDSATWKAMGVDRILIEKGQIEVSKRYKFDRDKLLITYNHKTTAYLRME